MTLASTIFYTGVNPYNGKKVYVARTKEEKLKQKELFFHKSPMKSPVNFDKKHKGNSKERK
jgi:hypothetical protein